MNNRNPGSDGARIPQRIYTFNDAWTEWLQGNKFPIAFFGDSTVDGVNTAEWVGNTVGADSTSPNSFAKKLEDILRKGTNNETLRIYNAGFSGQVASWAATVLDREFSGTSAYRDVKMIGIGFGINDRLGYSNEKAYRDGFKKHIQEIIYWCYFNQIQPFLLTTQAIVQPGVMTEYTKDYPMRTSEHIQSVANEVKRELADEFRIPLIDLNKFTEMFLLYSSHSAQCIISDRLHFGDIGHQYEAELIFTHLCPRTIMVDGYTKIDYSSQSVSDCVPEDWLTMPAAPTDSFKVYVDYVKQDLADMKIMTAWVFINAKKKLTLKVYKGSSSSDTYIKVNAVTKALTGTETVLGQLDMGLHQLEVFTGPSKMVDFKGFILD
ncbi:SGNH/GDSL hydrolase family protein [Paenibacillus beijingensis]|uniref:SGNH/GDSL hydrolase family protein n=1 Tax=Paenibacillus beijingensis TaxID=1126833 RepID=UPI0006990B2C|nr:SGNH/GDSL hydrolase family protein [Paenibacillus beijingensis]